MMPMMPMMMSDPVSVWCLKMQALILHRPQAYTEFLIVVGAAAIGTRTRAEIVKERRGEEKMIVRCIM